MRLSVDSDDPGYQPWAVGCKCRVLLDGIERSHVITADEERGMLVRFVTPLRVAPDGKSVERETLHGIVAILKP